MKQDWFRKIAGIARTLEYIKGRGTPLVRLGCSSQLILDFDWSLSGTGA